MPYWSLWLGLGMHSVLYLAYKPKQGMAQHT